MANFITSAYGNPDKIYKRSGFSSTVLDSFAAPDGSPWGIGYDGNNLLSSDYTTVKVYKHSGVSATILDSFASEPPAGLEWDESNLLVDDYSNDIYNKHSGFSATILSSFAGETTATGGITNNSTGFVGESQSASTGYYQHSGFTSTVTNSFTHTPAVRGAAWYNNDLYANDTTNDKFLRFSGFSATVLDSFAGLDTSDSGTAWEAAAVTTSIKDIIGLGVIPFLR